LSIKFGDGIAKNLERLAERLVFLAGVLICVWVVADVCGYKVTPSDLLTSLENAFRGRAGSSPHP